MLIPLTTRITKRKPGIQPIGDNRTIRITSQRRAEPDLKLFAQAVVETYLNGLGVYESQHAPKNPSDSENIA